MGPLEEQLTRLQKRIEGGISARFLKIMHKATSDLESSGMTNSVLRAGDHAPEFALGDQHGHLVNSQELLTQGPLVITFYRGFWCPYCNADLAHLQQFVSQIEASGARLIAISPELPEYSRKIVNTQKLTFDILHDAGNKLADRFGLRYSLPEDLKELYRNSFNINLKLYHGDNDWTLPIPARFVVDTGGVIRYAESRVDYRSRPEVDEVLETLQRVAASTR